MALLTLVTVCLQVAKTNNKVKYRPGFTNNTVTKEDPTQNKEGGPPG